MIEELKDFRVGIYAVRDKETKLHTPFVAFHDDEAKLRLKDYREQFPEDMREDFSLYRVGTFSAFCGEIIPCYEEIEEEVNENA